MEYSDTPPEVFMRPTATPAGSRRLALTMRGRVDAGSCLEFSNAGPCARRGVCPRRVRLATSRAHTERSRRLETTWLVVGPWKRADRIVRRTDGVASATLAHDSRGSQGPGQVQIDSAERHQRSRAAGACRRRGAGRGDGLHG